MIPVANKPILQHIVEALVADGVRDILLVTGYKRERIQSHFQDGKHFGASIEYVYQAKQMGTAHALLAAKGKVDGEFLVLPGDNLVDGKALGDLLRHEAPLKALVVESETPSKYGVVTLEHGRVTSIVEKPQAQISNLISTGIYQLTTDIFPVIEQLTAKGRYDLTESVQALVAQSRVVGVTTEGAWADAVYPWDLLRLNVSALDRIEAVKSGTVESSVNIRGKVSLGNGTVIRSGSYLWGPVSIGEGCEIGPSAVVLPGTSIGDDVEVGAFTQIEDSIVMKDASIGPSSFLSHSILGRGVHTGPHFSAVSGKADVRIDEEWHSVPEVGAFIGEDSVLANGVGLSPGVIVGAHCRVGPLTRIRENIPNGSIVV